MKTIEIINQEIKDLTVDANELNPNDKKTKRLKNKARKRIKMLMLARNYLELKPTTESIGRQFNEVGDNLRREEDKYNLWLLEGDHPKLAHPKNVYDLASPDIKKWKSEFNFLDYLLS